jgi:hypothetical protein
VHKQDLNVLLYGLLYGMGLIEYRKFNVPYTWITRCFLACCAPTRFHNRTNPCLFHCMHSHIDNDPVRMWADQMFIMCLWLSMRRLLIEPLAYLTSRLLNFSPTELPPRARLWVMSMSSWTRGICIADRLGRILANCFCFIHVLDVYKYVGSKELVYVVASTK